jgi:hypothetical protein
MVNQSDLHILRRPVLEGAKYGAIAGLIATWSISSAIAASEFEIGLPISTFYAMIGISLGSMDSIISAYTGFGLHLFTGTILGAMAGGIAVKIEMRKKLRDFFNPYRSILMGIVTGSLIWLVLFLPVTAMVIHPSINRIVEITSEQDSMVLSVFDTKNLEQSFRGIAISAIAFHIIWGAIFGFIISSFLRIRISSAISRSSSSIKSHKFMRSKWRIVSLGLISGLISSLAISGLILLVEKISSIPVGTFYYVLVSAATNFPSSNTEVVIAIGLAMHVLAGSFIGVVMSIPFIALSNNRNKVTNKGIFSLFIQKYSGVYGLIVGFGLWGMVFLPITFMLVIPHLSSFENQDIIISQRVPTGEVSSISFFGLLSMMDRIVYGALAFNVFYGLLTGIILQSLSERYLRSSDKYRRLEGTELLRDSGSEKYI